MNELDTTVNTKLFNKKFKPNGNPKHFRGNTIIWRSLENNTFDLLAKSVQSELISLQLKGIAFLPPASFHVTIMELLCDQVRQKELWSYKISTDIVMDEINRTLLNLLGGNKFELNINFLVKSLVVKDVFMLEVVPKSPDDLKKLTHFRNAISHKTGIRFPNHNNYGYHLTLGYILGNQFELNAIIEDIDRINKKYLNVPYTIEINFAYLVKFDHMGEFKIIPLEY